MTSSAAAGPPGPCAARPAARPLTGTSRPWSADWPRKIPDGGIAGSTAKWPDWALKSQRQPCGRSSRPAASTPPGGLGRPGWSQFLRSQADAILASDFFAADLFDGTQAYVLAVIEHASGRIRILGVTQHPIGEWTAQQARNLLMDLGEQAHRVKFMIRDRGPDFTTAFDAVLAHAGIRTVLCNVRTPRMNAIAERWIGGCRRELLDRTLIWNQAHLRRILREYETHHNQHRPHRSLHAAAPLKPLPEPVDLGQYRAPKTSMRRWPDQRISPGRMTWPRFSARTIAGRRPVGGTAGEAQAGLPRPSGPAPPAAAGAGKYGPGCQNGT